VIAKGRELCRVLHPTPGWSHKLPATILRRHSTCGSGLCLRLLPRNGTNPVRTSGIVIEQVDGIGQDDPWLLPLSEYCGAPSEEQAEEEEPIPKKL